MRYALINKDTKTVKNVIHWEGDQWSPPQNHFVIKSDIANIGDLYDEESQTFRKKPDFSFNKDSQ